MDNEVFLKVIVKFGDDFKIFCSLDYNFIFFVWYFCQFNCFFQIVEQWQIVVNVDNGIIKILNLKFDLDIDGLLILKDIQLSNDYNWVRCFFKKIYVYMDYRFIIICVV